MSAADKVVRLSTSSNWATEKNRVQVIDAEYEGKCSSAVQLKGGEGKQARRFRALPIGTSVLSLQLYFLSQNFLTYQYLTICLLLLLFHLTP